MDLPCFGELLEALAQTGSKSWDGGEVAWAMELSKLAFSETLGDLAAFPAVSFYTTVILCLCFRLSKIPSLDLILEEGILVGCSRNGSNKGD